MLMIFCNEVSKYFLKEHECALIDKKELSPTWALQTTKTSKGSHSVTKSEFICQENEEIETQWLF